MSTFPCGLGGGLVQYKCTYCTELRNYTLGGFSKVTCNVVFGGQEQFTVEWL